VLYKIGGLQGLHEKLADPAMLSMVTPKDISLFYLIVISIVALIGTGGMPSIITAGGAGRTELDGRVGMTGGNFLKRLCTIPWCLTGVAAIVYYAGKQIHPDKVFGALANECLTGIMPGLLGVFIAATMAAVMSGCSAFMVSSAALFTENFYKVFVLNKNAGHYILVGRIASIAVVGCGVAFALWVRDVPKGLEIFWAVSTMISIAFWMGIFWRRTTKIGAWAATLAALAAWWLSTQSFFISCLSNLPANETLRLVVIKGTGPEMYLPWQMIFYLSAGILGGIIGSFLTKPLPEKRLDDFYALLRTPVQPGEKPSASCTLPEGVVPAPRRNLLPFKSIELPVPSKVAMLGFLVSWAVVALLIYVVYFIVNVL
jgi:Na+/proline symporter